MYDRCANCNRYVGADPSPYVWGQTVVCAACYELLATRALPHQAQIPRSKYPVPAIQPIQEHPIDSLQELAAAAGSSRVIVRRVAQYSPKQNSGHLSWMIAGIAIVVAATVVILVITNGGAGRGGVSLISAPPGKVKFTVTWKYNNFVGNRGDTGAVVVLIPDGLAIRLPDDGISPLTASMTLSNTKKELAQHGAYISIIGGDGKATLSGVKSGKYRVVILSKNTNDSLESRTSSQSRLETYFLSGSAAALSKLEITEVDVPSGDEVEVTHDFGFTYY